MGETKDALVKHAALESRVHGRTPGAAEGARKVSAMSQRLVAGELSYAALVSGAERKAGSHEEQLLLRKILEPVQAPLIVTPS